jgi:hypothetical protein
MYRELYLFGYPIRTGAAFHRPPTTGFRLIPNLVGKTQGSVLARVGGPFDGAAGQALFL